jgi:hypothetical protein
MPSNGSPASWEIAANYQPWLVSRGCDVPVPTVTMQFVPVRTHHHAERLIHITLLPGQLRDP